MGDRNQIFAIRADGGEAVQLTKAEAAVSNFAVVAGRENDCIHRARRPNHLQKDRKEHLGDYEVVRREYQHVHLWTFDVEEALRSPVAGRQRTKGRDFSVTAFSWAPDGRSIAFSATNNPDLINGGPPTSTC